MQATTDYDLPRGAYHPTEEEFELPFDPTHPDSPHTVSEIEQLIRVAISLAGKDCIGLVNKACEYQKEWEEKHCFDSFDYDRSRIDKTNDPWLTDVLSDVADDIQSALDYEREKYENRMYWYDKGIQQSLKSALDKASELIREGVSYRHETIVESDPQEGEISIDTLLKGKARDIREFGYELPVTVTICDSKSSDSLYPFIPWCDTTMCTCPHKHKNPTSTLCKHEIAALILTSRDNFNPTGPTVPARFDRLVSHHDYNRFMKNIA